MHQAIKSWQRIRTLQASAVLSAPAPPLLGAVLLSGISSTNASSPPSPVSPRLPAPPGPPNSSCSGLPVCPRESNLSTILSPPAAAPTPPLSPCALPSCALFLRTPPTSTALFLATASSSLSLCPTSDKSSPSPQPLRGAFEKPFGVANGESEAPSFSASSASAGVQRSCGA